MSVKKILIACLILTLFLLGACSQPPAETPPTEAPEVEAPAEETVEAEEPEAEKHWSYEGDTGPEYWGDLKPEYAACGEGMEQSPVDIVGDAPVNPDDAAYAYEETAVTIVNNGHAIQVNYDEGSTAEIDGTEYALQQFHFHSLSEHQLDGANTDMEMHLVHADADGNNAVVSVMLVEGAENPAFAPVWDNMPAEEGDPVTVEGAFVNVDDLLPEDRSYYHYMGSLTTPPCTEGVNWHVLATPVELSADQLAQFRAIHDGTNRPVQPMNDREFLAAEMAEAEHHWSYEGETGPEYWGTLEAEYAACGEGLEQSPVDIPADAPVNPDDVAYAYEETAVTIVNNGHAIQVNYDEGSTAEIDGTEYAQKQFHFHSLSEHELASANTDMEMHLVHADADGNNAVVSVMLVEGDFNPAYAPVWDNLPDQEGDPVTTNSVVNVDDLLPEDRSYYHYMGSLTTPPCTEGVNWHVLTTPVELSADQIAAFRAIHDGTNRPVQPMNDREFLGAEMTEMDEAEEVHFSYEGDTGPEFWGELKPEYATCGTGMAQSPIDIPADAIVNPDDVAYAYAETAVNIVNNGHAIQVNYDEGSTAVIDGTEYDLKQFHFHSLSEHALAGANTDMEMHLVHADANGHNAVVSVMLVEGEENPAFAPVWDNMPAEEGDAITVEGAFVNVDDLLPEDRSYYHYMGSLTTPPCTEGVNWHVLATPVELSADQLAQFRAIHDGTNRPVQPMNGRQFLNAAEPLHFSYEGDTGPALWGTLRSEYVACGVGMEQSPVDISDAPVNEDDVAYGYSETAVTIVNNGHAIQVNYDEGSTAEIDGTEYALKQFHFHSLSEHQLDSANTDMEMHLVHADADGNNAVVSVMLVEGAENPAFAPVWDNMPAEEGEPVTIDGAVINVDDLLPEDRSYYHYMGSLTTPPCTEGVNWHVLATPVELSADQLAQFRAIHDGTNRPVQPMNARVFQ